MMRIFLIAFILGICLPQPASARVVKQDADDDGVIDRIGHYDSSNRLVLLEVDNDGDGVFEVQQKYDKGKLWRLLKDTDGDKYFDRIDYYNKGVLVKQQQYRSDKTLEQIVFIDSSGKPKEFRKDTDGDGEIDYIRYLEHGVPVSATSDDDHDGRMETIIFYKKGKLHKVERDSSGDGTVDYRERYDDGVRVGSEHDQNGDGRIDTWQKYKDGDVVLMTTDESGDGRIDVKVHYSNGEKELFERDDDGDGYFETTQHYNIDGWDTVLSVDNDGNGQPEVRQMFKAGKMREKQYYLPDGTLKYIESYNPYGALVRRADRDSSGLTRTVYYDLFGKLVRAELDKDSDDVPEENLIYENGIVSRIEKDTNGDGFVDVWEEYNEKGKQTASAKDIDFDGVADLFEGRMRHPVPMAEQEHQI